ncbi:MAG: hypothetical protein AB1630_02570 [bacterium]
MKKEDVLSFIKGYKNANRAILEEKKKRLCSLTCKDSLLEYEHLCKIYEDFNKEGIKDLENKKILFLIERRKRFNKMDGR